jgi:hypothetical protein
MPNNINDLCGWIQPTQEETAVCLAVLPMPLFSDEYGSIKGSGKGKRILLSDYFKALTGRHAFRVQETGDCVSFGSAYAVDFTYAAEIISKGENEIWVAETATEDIYGGSRVQIGNSRLGTGQGSLGIWAARYVTEYGTLIRTKYEHDDLSKYEVARATKWGNPGNGVPKYLQEIAKEHKIRTTSMVTTYEEARDAIANGYAITVASNRGFSRVRDSEGFLKPAGSWGHQMCLMGVNDDSKRPALLCMNSWPMGWVSGPLSENQPEGSFWIDADVVERDMLSKEDSFVYSDRVGFPAKKLDWGIY